MSLLTGVLSLQWLEGDRGFSIAFGTLLCAISLSLAIPILWWFLPKHRRAIFPRDLDQRYLLQLFFGLVCMGMAFTNALCRYIPHGPLGYTHPVFFITTLALAMFLGPRVLAAAGSRAIPTLRVSSRGLLAALAAFIALPLGTTIEAFLR